MMIDDLSYIPHAFRAEIAEIPPRCRRWCYAGDGDGDGGGDGDVGFGDPGIGAAGPSAADFGGIGFGGDVDEGIGLGGSEGFDFSGESAGIGGAGFGGGFGGGTPFDPSGLQAQIDALMEQFTGLTSVQSQFDQTRALEQKRFDENKALEAQRFGARNALEASRFGAAQELEAERDARAFGALEPFSAAGRGAIGSIPTTAAGLDRSLGEIFSGSAFQKLRGERERSLRGQLAAGGLTRSGEGLTQIANVPTELGFNIEQRLAGRQRDILGRGLQASLGQAGLRAPGLQESLGRDPGLGQLPGLGGLQQLAGLDISSLDAETRKEIARLNAETQLQVGRTSADAQKSSSTSNLLGTALGIGAVLAFSDRALKTNIERIAGSGVMPVYKWEWIEGVPDCVASCPTVGFMADDVEALYPDCVHEFGGFKMVDYAAVNARAAG